MSKEKRPIPDYWYGIIAAIAPVIVSVSLTGFIGWLYRDQVFAKPSSVENSPITTPTPIVETKVVPTSTSTPTPEYESHTPAHLFYINGQYLICKPVDYTATTSLASLQEYGDPESPYHIIINGDLYEPSTLDDPLFSFMGEDDFACLALAE